MDGKYNHVLIVEDDKEIRKGVEIYLQSQGYQVFQAADGIEGLEIIGREEIHLAIVDVMMPRMDGITMTRKLREKHDFPIIFLSAKSEEVDKILGLNMGADDYVTKPFTPMELLAQASRGVCSLCLSFSSAGITSLCHYLWIPIHTSDLNPIFQSEHDHPATGLKA